MSLTISLTGILKRLTRLSNNPLAPWLKHVAVAERKKVQARIRTLKVDPDGERWAPWEKSTESHRRAKGNTRRGLLYDEGLLLASIISSSTATSAEISTATPYAPFLQAGTAHMTHREFMGWGDVSLAQYELEAVHALEKAAR